jgi:hypothetical protein
MSKGTRRNPLAAIPHTRAGRRLLLGKLRKLSEAQTESALRIWFEVHASLAPQISQWKATLRRRIHGAPGAQELEVAFDRVLGTLVVRTRSSGFAIPKKPIIAAMSKTQHADELAALDVQVCTQGEEGDEVVLDPRHATLTQRAASGNADALAELGIAELFSYAFPVAFVTAGAERDPKSNLICVTEVPDVPRAQGFDALQVLKNLRAEGVLPLASDEDVVRFAMLIASPLMRGRYPGLLGIYWVYGPAGSGKDLLITLARLVWEFVGLKESSPPNALLSLSCVESEDRKTFASNFQAVYANLAEAGKRKTSEIEYLIRLSGTSHIAARGLYANEVSLRNTFTYVASSVETPLQRREIGRRVVIIRTVSAPHHSDAVKRIVEIAELLIGSFMDIIEQGDPTPPANPGGRPLAISLLASYFNATLESVVGESLDELFRAMALYVGRLDLHRGGDATVEKAAAVFLRHKAYRAAHFVEVMMNEKGYEEFFKQLRFGKFVFERINRELAEPAGLTGKGAEYATVEVDGEEYGLRFTEPRHDVFVFFKIADEKE